MVVVITEQCHKIVGEYEDDLIDAFLAKTIDVKKEMCEEITGDQYACAIMCILEE